MELALDFRPSPERPAALIEQDRLEQLLACTQLFIGHELPNMLLSCQGFARLLGKQAGQLDEESRLHLDRLAVLTHKADSWARQLARIGRLLRGSPWGPAIDLGEAAREAVAEVNAGGDLPGVDFQISDNLPSLRTSHALLHAVLVQLLRNSARAVLTTAHGQVEVTGRQETDGCLIAVRDNGSGLSSAQANLLLEPFAAARFPGASGIGLGFFLIRQAVARWGGVLLVRSRVGQGTTVEVLVPAGDRERT
jgi:signal transduction histidine kinase